MSNDIPDHLKGAFIVDNQTSFSSGSSVCSGSAIDRRWLERKGFYPLRGGFALDFDDADGDPAILEYVLGDSSACISVPGEPWVAIPFGDQSQGERVLTVLGVQ
jgi:hypothetical protein